MLLIWCRIKRTSIKRILTAVKNIFSMTERKQLQQQQQQQQQQNNNSNNKTTTKTQQQQKTKPVSYTHLRAHETA